MSGTIIDRYREYRALGVSAKNAIAWARSTLARDLLIRALDITIDGAPFRYGGYDITIEVENDKSADMSHLGEFTDKWSDGAVSTGHPDGRVYRWFIPEITERRHYKSLRVLKFGRSEAGRLAREYVLRDYKTAESYVAFGIIVTAHKDGIRIGTDSIWGCAYEDGPPSLEEAVDTVLDHGMIDNAIGDHAARLAA